MDVVFRLDMNETLRFLRVMGALRRDRADLVYDLLDEKHLWSETTRYINLGYWRNAGGIDEASTQLVELVGQRAALGANDRIFDAGFGFGDQDIYWMQRFQPRHIDGVNVSARQVTRARQRVDEAGLADRITFWLSDAAEPHFPGGTFDKIIALESAFHFRTRKKFFSHAARLLRPGGMLVLADFVAHRQNAANFPAWVGKRFGSLAWQIPMVNLHSIDIYTAQLREHGFRDIIPTDITADVIAPFKRFMNSRLKERRPWKHYHPLVLWGAKLQMKLGFLDSLDYYIVSATKA
jgi:cyclopropane fatty-acyl-phospholipid synthase-like methyltransferase